MNKFYDFLTGSSLDAKTGLIILTYTENMSLKYPSGHIKYSFNMYVDHGKSIICDIDDSRIQKINLNKSFPEDPFDPKWQLVIIFFEVSSIEEVDSIGAEIKDDIFNLLCFKLKVGISDIRLTGHGVTPREGEGAQCHMIMPAMTCYGEAKSGGRKLYQAEVDEIERRIQLRSATPSDDAL